MEGFVEDQITVRIRLLTASCAACAEIKEIEYVRSEMAAYRPDTPTFREAFKQREEWEQEHAKECTRRPIALVSAVPA